MAVGSESVEQRSLVTVGTHCILELYDCPPERLNALAFIRQALREAASEAQSTLLKEIAHQFHPQGITALVLLAESHISIHTWPETGYAAIDVFTCGHHTDPQRACQYLIRKLRARKHSLMTLPRHTPLSDKRRVLAPYQQLLSAGANSTAS